MTEGSPAALEVAAGIIRNGNLILVARRAKGHLAGHWEFPGGKLEAGETPGEALKRELREELGIEIDVGRELVRRRTQGDSTELELIFIEGRYRCGSLQLIDHDAAEWAAPSALPGYRFESRSPSMVLSNWFSRFFLSTLRVST